VSAPMRMRSGFSVDGVFGESGNGIGFLC